ncbi:hypothetical protein [Paenibacillus sp. YPG26]|uniref:hypothetical protein n=1 Tax=Paenibacillus sp. YPG26 TaxID=2878915 RepID=UPI002041E03A|nr:hypothetical protein [Paenibacillus sp. YPG26]USB31913.1 hypothetical protein LDO05_11215 [Paenibacillus sp. YPG26]
MRRIALVLGAVLALGGCSGGNMNKVKQESAVQAPIPKNEQQGQAADQKQLLDPAALGDTYSFADRTGKYLIAFTGNQDKSLNKAIGEGGKVLDVKYVRKQSGSEKDDGRQWAKNFGNLEGLVFEVVGGQAVPDQTYYLANDRKLNIHAVIPVISKVNPDVEDSVKQAIREMKAQSIEKIWEIGQIGQDNQIYLAQFEKKGKKATASIILKQGSQIVTRDYTADYDPNSTWRVDDGGTVTPEMFSFLFAAATERGILLGMEWAGAEGRNAFFLNQTEADLVELEIKGGRYMSP